ncbi:hypothetical protein H5410_012776 [Solanum commersonii]|uniref:Uncharacterized protein n=1 Tax=Solanum commersonii TaxID=4109 RepID=A0A9J6ASM0_SOLCO|nr:hypothetical protein H5410_012776 [Solanum commersonii]
MTKECWLTNVHLLEASSYENLWSSLTTFALASALPWKLLRVIASNYPPKKCELRFHPCSYRPGVPQAKSEMVLSKSCISIDMKLLDFLCAYLFHLSGADHKREKSAIEKLEESPSDIVMTKNNPLCVIIVHIDSLIVATKSVCILKFPLNDMEEQ